MKEKIGKIVENIQEHAGDFPTDGTAEFVEELLTLIQQEREEAVLSYEKEIFDFQTDLVEDISGIESMVIKIPVITWRSIRKKYLSQQSLDKGDGE